MNQKMSQRIKLTYLYIVPGLHTKKTWNQSNNMAGKPSVYIDAHNDALEFILEHMVKSR